MARNYTFPHMKFNLIDESAETAISITEEPMHLPLFVCFAEKGQVNKPIIGSTAEIMSMFGSNTFSERSDYYNHQTLFAGRAAGNQKICFARIVPTDATTGNNVLQATVEEVSVIQYQRDSLGGYIYDADGNPIPQTQSDGVTVVTEPGVSITWSTRALAENESYNKLLPVTTGVNGVQKTAYPIFATSATSPGKYINRTGYRFYYSDDIDTTIVDNTGSLLYRFEPIEKDSTTDLATSIRNKYSQTYVDVSLAASAYDSTTATYYNMDEYISNNYSSDALPFEFYVYSSNVEAIGNLVLEKSPELTDVNAFQVNIMKAVDYTTGYPYKHLVVNGSDTVVNENVVLYHSGGSDGSIDNTNYETMVAAYLAGDLYPEINDYARWPITHFYDTGFSLAIKEKFLDMWTNRPDVKIDFCTQDSALDPNIAAEDISTASYLRGLVLVHPENTVYGTPAVRASITMQCGRLNDTQTYTNYVPFLLDRMIKRCIYDGKPYISGSPKGRPESEVTLFDLDTVNWTPYTNDMKQNAWDVAGNVAVYCSNSAIFYPDIRSVYPLDSSLLSSDVFVDYMIYLQKLAYEAWTMFAGIEEPLTRIQDRVSRYIDKRTNYVFGNRIRTSTTVYQTDSDTAAGSNNTVQIAVYGSNPNRIWNVLVPVRREES